MCAPDQIDGTYCSRHYYFEVPIIVQAGRYIQYGHDIGRDPSELAREQETACDVYRENVLVAIKTMMAIDARRPEPTQP